MKIDMEQFLALTVAFGCAGAVGYAVYADRADMQEVIAGIEATEDPAPAEAEPEPSPPEEVAAAVVEAPAEPTDLDAAAGIPPVVPDVPGSYAPGPTTESMM